MQVASEVDAWTDEPGGGRAAGGNCEDSFSQADAPSHCATKGKGLCWREDPEEEAWGKGTGWKVPDTPAESTGPLQVATPVAQCPLCREFSATVPCGSYAVRVGPN